MPRLIPILNLGQVSDLALGDQDRSADLFHAFGIFIEKKITGQRIYYAIFDEHKKVDFRLGGTYSEYDTLSPQPGDIIRIHRSRIIFEDKEPRINLARDVVVWPGFQDNPKPRHHAKSPTLKEDDNKRRIELEKYFCTRRSRLIDLSRARIEPGNVSGQNMYDFVAGRLEKRTFDCYGHAELLLSDGSGPNILLKVFKRNQDNFVEVNHHYDIASQLDIGQYVVATSVKLRETKGGFRILNLSANLYNGRSFRIVEPMSELGEELAESIAQREQPIGVAQPAAIPALPRRSPRFLQGVNGSNNLEATIVDTSSTTQHQLPPIYPEFPPQFTPHNSIKPDSSAKFSFHNMVGIVREEPTITRDYGNCVVQIYDGSGPVYPNYFRHEVKEPLDECMIVYIYCKQSERDTDEHFNVARSVKEGDLVYLTNVKITFKGEPLKIRAELNANRLFHKSFNVIDKDSAFGDEILGLIGSPNLNPDIPKTDHVLETISQLDEDDRTFGLENPL